MINSNFEMNTCTTKRKYLNFFKQQPCLVVNVTVTIRKMLKTFNCN